MSINHLLQEPNKLYDINGTPGIEVIRDYRHAKRVFIDGNYRLSPKFGFLFYVEFDFNPLISTVTNVTAQELGMIVKRVNLPKYSIETKTYNAYNRKNIVQSAIRYDPVEISFHDDMADNVRQFWYDYYSFYYRDSDYADATYQIIHKYQERPSFDWGYTPRPNPSYNSSNAYQTYQYIQAIRIYSLYQNNFSEYELVNPIITSFRHGEHDVSQSANIMENSMTVTYETVKYYTGYVTPNTVGGFIDLHYDNTPSPIAPSQGTDIIDNGQGGFVPASDVITDLANNNTLTQGGSVVAQPNRSVLAGAISAANAAQYITGQASNALTNNGGFLLPSLGTLTTGFTNGSIVGQQLSAAAVALAGTSAATLSSGIVKGVANGLGTSTGTLATIGAAIANPSAALATVENMATGYATGLVTGAVNNLVGQASQTLTTSISNFISSTGISQTISSLSQSFTSAAGDITNGLLTGSLSDIQNNLVQSGFTGLGLGSIENPPGV